MGLLVVSAGLALTGCGGSGNGSPAAGSTEGTTTNATTTQTETEPLEGAGTDPVTGEASAAGTALLEEITLGRHEGFDRVVLRFRNHIPGYRVVYATGPFVEDGSGNPVEVDGDAFVVVRMEPASGFDLESGEGELVYKGPKRIEGSDHGASEVGELARTGDFEAVLTWVVGLSDRVDFKVTTLDGPARLVVDFRNG